MTTKSANEQIVVPRDKDGHIVPMVTGGGVGLGGETLYYPVLSPHPSGKKEAFLQFDKLRDRIQFVPAFYNGSLGLMADGTVREIDLSRVVPLNPVYAMPQLQEGLENNGVPPAMLPAAQQMVTTLLSQGIAPVFNEMPEESDLYIPDGKGNKVRACNCQIQVEFLREVITEKGSSFEVELRLTRRKNFKVAEVHTAIVAEADLDNLEDALCRKYPWFHLAAETNGVANKLSEYLRDQLDSVPMVTVFRCAGWQEHKNRHIFVHDGAVAPNDVEFNCGLRIIADEKLNPVQAFKEALAILNIGKLTVTLPLLLITLLGPMFRLFEAGGYIPRFCGFLFGISGSLKTSVAEVFYRFFNQQQHGSFRDTAAAIDVTIKEHHDRLLLVDDFQPAVIAAEGKAMAKVLEHVIRLFGDDVAKRRSNSKATAAYGDRPKGSCLITGETTSGSYSSLLRCLLIPIARDDIDGDLLRRYQEMPARWTTNYYYMLPWLGRNWNVLAEKIRREFPQWRKAFGAVTREPRLVDAGAVLMLVAEIFLWYGTSCTVLTSDQVDVMLREWRTVIESLLVFSAESAQARDVVTLTREAILRGVTMGTLKIAPDLGGFATGSDGFYSENRLWLQQQSFDRMLRQYCAEEQIACVNGTKTVLPELYKRGLIIRDEENGKNSYLKRSPEIPAIGKRLRMIVFLQSELDREE